LPKKATPQLQCGKNWKNQLILSLNVINELKTSLKVPRASFTGAFTPSLRVCKKQDKGRDREVEKHLEK
jgi:hypothetical protein